MNINSLIATAQALVAPGKGLLAMDESTGTCNARFAALGIPETVEARRAYRELLVTTPGLGEGISGAILFDETIRQRTAVGVPFVEILQQAGIMPGIKVDVGAHELAGFPGEQVTEGLDDLRARLAEYAGLGARFAKWRAVLAIGTDRPSRACIEANAHALARYAALCQAAGLVPIVEPEVLLTGPHSLAQCAAVTEDVLHEVFAQLRTQGVALEGMLLKPSMVLAGNECPKQPTTSHVADATLASLLRTVPAAVPGVAFLSGGQSPEQATRHLAAMHERRGRLPWALTFSFGRALHQPALEAWGSQPANVAAAQQALLSRVASNRAAVGVGEAAAAHA
ncbi:class I fructose-bisphosphate aldolase [Hymenobacter sp. PAMC 26628]|uniref:class I fructose-bisphosphate aldolase n=1 Tax=Hymenobacter sp. PAMC 26628 TaxID=1484118 RepID=UPI0007700388|nr:class I fructose-bisphosphate aldolase [Hymenobacter sp. PAMC 26628]AMJ66002.1 fructose-bisphosphate aldolase [Hymenobacter sp. PAMC 26628]